MSSFLVPEEYQETVFEKMNPVALKVFDKNMKPIIEPSHGIVHGYIMCSQIDMEQKDLKIHVDTIEELEQMYNDNKVDLQQRVYLNGKMTTFGRAKMEAIIGIPLNVALGDENEYAEITNSNITELMRYIANADDPAGITKDLREFTVEMSTLEGFTSLSLDQLRIDIPKEYRDKAKAIREDETLDGVQKFVRLNDNQNDIKKWIGKNMNQDLKLTMEQSNRMKLSALMEINC